MREDEGVRQRLTSYWKMEAGCAFVVPPLALYASEPREPIEIAAVTLAVTATSLLLAVGAGYWRCALKRAQGDRRSMQRFLRAASGAESPLLLLTIAALIATAAAFIQRGWSSAVIAASICSIMALLEFVNYYRIQLQHFDHVQDFRRMMKGQGFKEAHMARDLRKFRQAAARK